MVADTKHPADEIGKSLARASGILTLLSSCYDKQSASFETGGNFAYESIVAIEAILSHASDALGNLYQSYDLTLIDTSVPIELPLAEVTASPVAAAQEATLFETYLAKGMQQRQAAPVSLTSYLSSFGPPETGSRLADRMDSALSRSFGLDAQAGRAEVMNRPAESYDELLVKLTAVANQAATQGNQPDLLPALEELRADLIKLRSVA